MTTHRYGVPVRAGVPGLMRSSKVPETGRTTSAVWPGRRAAIRSLAVVISLRCQLAVSCRACCLRMSEVEDDSGMQAARGSQAARRCSNQIVAASAAAVIATMRPASMNWKFQNRSAGW